jgi:hypothetical protein
MVAFERSDRPGLGHRARWPYIGLMAAKTYSGSCHCGAVRFEADIDLAQGSMRCNCSLCSKARAWFLFVTADHLRITAGEEALADYQWTPAGKPHPALHYRFCRTCGVRAFAHGVNPALGGAFYAVAVAALDLADRGELAAAPIKYLDGLHDRYDRAPDDTRTM